MRACDERLVGERGSDSTTKTTRGSRVIALVVETSSPYACVCHLHSETPSGENQNLFATLTVRTYVRIVPNWTLQQSTERQV